MPVELGEAPKDPIEFSRWVESVKLDLEREKLEIEREKLKLASSPLARVGPLVVPILVGLLAAAVALVVALIQISQKTEQNRVQILAATRSLDAAKSDTQQLKANVEANVADLTNRLNAFQALAAASTNTRDGTNDALSNLEHRLADLSKAQEEANAKIAATQTELGANVADLANRLNASQAAVETSVMRTHKTEALLDELEHRLADLSKAQEEANAKIAATRDLLNELSGSRAPHEK
jgi:chromosome segregation ATPase